MGNQNWDGEFKDSSNKNNKGLTRRIKEEKHWDKNKKSKRGQLYNDESRRSKNRELIGRYMSGGIDEDEFNDY